MFKILRGTVDVENDKLGQAMMESRSQIKLFQEIENMKGQFFTFTVTITEQRVILVVTSFPYNITSYI